MTEATIFEFLLKNRPNSSEKTYDFPKLRPDSAGVIAEVLADIIYENKVSVGKRLNILNFIRALACDQDNHVAVNERNCHILVDKVSQTYVDGDDQNLNDFVAAIQKDLILEAPLHVADAICRFRRRRLEKNQQRIKFAEAIQKFDQSRLPTDTQFVGGSSLVKIRNCPDLNDDFIYTLLGTTDNAERQKGPDLFPKSGLDSLDYREKQVKFAYALVNAENWPVLLKLLVRLSNYRSLTSFEINLLSYLRLTYLPSQPSDQQLVEICGLIDQKFDFVYDKEIIKLCTSVIELETQPQVEQYFEDILFNSVVDNLKKICEKNVTVKTKLKSLMYQLYACSYCNSNVLKLMEYIF